MSASIKMNHAALADAVNGDIILRGVIDPQSLHLLQVADYQREVLPLAKISELVEAFEKGSVPDVDLGMRGERFMERSGCFYLQDAVFIVDGLQRVTAALHLIQRATGVMPQLGAVVHFSTTVEWERERFRILNQDRTKLSPNILLRNLSSDYEVVDMLRRLSDDSGFVLQGRICWNQRMTRQELLTAMTYAKVVGVLHSHLGATLYNRTEDLSRGLNGVMNLTGKNIMRHNIRTFFDVVDAAWGIKRVAFKEGAVYMRANFLMTLARVFSNHLDFWREEKFFVEVPLIKKLSTFPVSDPQVANLASSSGTSKHILYTLMVDHINSGKRTRRLKPRNNDYASYPAESSGGGEEEEE